MTGCPVSLLCAVAWRIGELSQQPTWPHSWHIRRCTHHPPAARHSWQPSSLGGLSRRVSRCVQVAIRPVCPLWSAGRGVGKTDLVDAVLTSLALVMLFVLIGGYFSGSELAVLTLRDSQADRLPGRRGARVRKLRADSSRFLASVQVGVTFAGFFASAYGGSTLSEPLGAVLAGWGLPRGPAEKIAFVGVTAFISYLSLVFGELVPKRLALQRAETISLFVSPVLDVVAKVMRPVVWLLSMSTNLLVRMLGLDPRAGSEQVTEEELRNMVSTNVELGAEERRVLTDVFG